jgi:hypothetical protein
MDNDKKTKPTDEKEQTGREDDSSEPQVCSKPFDPENARSKDTDDPCCNGEG